MWLGRWAYDTNGGETDRFPRQQHKIGETEKSTSKTSNYFDQRSTRNILRSSPSKNPMWSTSSSSALSADCRLPHGLPASHCTATHLLYILFYEMSFLFFSLVDWYPFNNTASFSFFFWQFLISRNFRSFLFHHPFGLCSYGHCTQTSLVHISICIYIRELNRVHKASATTATAAAAAAVTVAAAAHRD